MNGWVDGRLAMGGWLRGSQNGWMNGWMGGRLAMGGWLRGSENG